MNLLEILGYPLYLVAALEILLAVLLLTQNPRNSPVHKAVAVLFFFSAAFSLCTSVMYTRASLGLSFNLFARANWIGWLTIPAGFQSIFYLKDEKSRRARVVGLVLYPFWLAMLCLSLFTNLIVTDAYSLVPYINRPGPLEYPARLIGGMLTVWLMYETIKLRRQVSGLKRVQLGYFLTGILIFAGGGSATAGFLQLFGGFGFEPGLGSYFSLPWVLLTFHAITRYRLFDLRIIISRTVTIVFLSLIFSAVQMGLFEILKPALGDELSIPVSLLIIGFVFFGTPFSRIIQGWIQKLIIHGKYDYQRILRKSTRGITTILELDELLKYIIDSVRAGLGVENACLYLKGDDGRYTMRYGFGAYEEMTDKRSLADIAVQWLSYKQQPVIREELETTLPEEGIGNLNTYMRGIGAELIIPLWYKGQLQGALTLGRRGGGDLYAQSDIDLLETLAGHAAAAIENARLYEETRQAKESLEESEEKFRALAQMTPAAIFIHQGEKFLYANPSAVSISGYAYEELLAMDFWGLVHPDFRELVRERGRSRLRGAEVPQQYEFKLVRKDGGERWALMTAGVIEYEGRPAVIANIFDITDRKQAECGRGRASAPQ